MVWLTAGLMILILLALLRAILGPTVIDRLLAINAISSMIVAIILLLAFFHDNYSFVDVAIVFVLCGFIGNLWILRVLAPERWNQRLSQVKGILEKEEEVVSSD